jgi:methyl-accepting chemotaxis protein
MGRRQNSGGKAMSLSSRDTSRLGIAARLIIPFVGITLFTTLSLATLSFVMTGGALTRSLEEKSQSMTRNMADVLKDPLSLGEFDHMLLILSSAQRSDPDLVYAYILSPDGTAVAATDTAIKNTCLNRDAFEKAALEAKDLFFHDKPGSDVKEWVMPIKSGGQLVGTLRAGFSRKRVTNDILNAEIPVALIGLAGLAVGIVTYLYLIRGTIIGPITNLVQTATTIARGDLGETVVVTRADEIGQLLASMNDMIEYLREMAQVADAIASGDLRVRVSARSTGDVFGNAFMKMVESLCNIIRQLAEGAQGLSTAAQQLAATSGEQSVMLSEHASAIQESLATLEGIRAIVTHTSQQARTVVEISERSLDVSKAGQVALGEAIAAMEKIREQVTDIAQNIVVLRGKTVQIGDITASVSDIAGQSNLLAVNATMEAVKAGEVGRGFRVVATEVKNLAMQSQKATENVYRILSEIQKAMGSTVAVTEEGSTRVESGVSQVHEIGTNFNELYRVILDSSNAAQQIAQATNQEVAGIEQIAQGMKGILQAANTSVAGAQQQSATANNLSNLASSLNNIVRAYRLQ